MQSMAPTWVQGHRYLPPRMSVNREPEPGAELGLKSGTSVVRKAIPTCRWPAVPKSFPYCCKVLTVHPPHHVNPLKPDTTECFITVWDCSLSGALFWSFGIVCCNSLRLLDLFTHTCFEQAVIPHHLCFDLILLTSSQQSVLTQAPLHLVSYNIYAVTCPLAFTLRSFFKWKHKVRTKAVEMLKTWRRVSSILFWNTC